MEMVSPNVHTTPPAKFKSAPETPTVPCATQSTPVNVAVGNKRQYPAVPAAPVAAAVIAAIVRTPPDAVAGVVTVQASEASNVPEETVAHVTG